MSGSPAIATVAAVLESPSSDFVVEEVSLEAPGRNEVLVRIESSGVCHSDWNAATGASVTPLPAVLGHEGAGVVEAVGSAVTTVKPGQKVVLSWLPWCGNCAACLRGELSQCADALTEMGAGSLPGGGFRLRRASGRLYHYSYLSTFARHAVVHERSCVVLPDDADLEVASLVGCAVMTGVGAVINKARVRAGSNVVIFGAGGVGLSAMLAARLAGAQRIVVVEPVASKRETALSLGATHAVDPGDAIHEQVSAICPGGADYAFEATGKPALATAAFSSIRLGGTLVMIGLPPDGEMVSFPGAALVRSERVVTGVLYGSSRPPIDMPMIMRLYSEGRLPLDRLISRRYPLTSLNEAFADMNGGRVVRGVVKPWED
jgi:S-(hydroxymethyl)glutathione dehydrogenase/alcohol dehydrogenase